MIVTMNQTRGVLASGVLNNVSQSSCTSSELFITNLGSLDLVRKLHQRRLVLSFTQGHEHSSFASSIEDSGSHKVLVNLVCLLQSLFLQVVEYLLLE